MQLADEVAIVWETDLCQLEYLRETWTTAWTRQGLSAGLATS